MSAARGGACSIRVWREVVSVLAGVLAVGGEGLDLGDGQVDGVGGGDRGQVAAGAVGGGVGG